MLSIPLPFVVSLLLIVMATGFFTRKTEQLPLAAYFLLICAATTALVGLRWLLDWPLLRTLQPIVASGIPVMAWYVFARARTAQPLPWWHGIAPAAVAIGSLTANWWTPPLDIVLAGTYTLYGLALWRAASAHLNLAENIPIADMPRATFTTRLAGVALLFSALIDGAISVNFMLWDGAHALLIITLAHAVLLPVLALAVMWMSLHTQVENDIETTEKAAANPQPPKTPVTDKSSDEDEQLLNRVEAVLTGQKLYLDPDLTLAKLARKSGVPSRLISSAVNQRLHLNISQWVNQFRIEQARHLLATTELPVTELYLEAGFQTKSNFHREFSRQVGCTPSEFRKANRSK